MPDNENQRIRLECRNCDFACSSTDPLALSYAADMHERRRPGHRMVDA